MIVVEPAEMGEVAILFFDGELGLAVGPRGEVDGDFADGFHLAFAHQLQTNFVTNRREALCAKISLPPQRKKSRHRVANFSGKRPGQFLFTGRRGPERSMTTRQYARLVSEWIGSVGLDPRLFGTHSLRRTKATLIYRRTGNLRAVQLLLGHTKIESTVRYLGIEVDDALAIAEQVDV